MVNGDIDTYNAKFEDQCQLAGYTVGNEETVYAYLRELPPGCQRDVLRSPTVHTYPEIKQCAVNSAKAQQLINSLTKQNELFQTQNFQNAFRPPQPQPFFLGRNQRQGQGQGGAPPVNSSNAPRWMNNTPVPMDLSRRNQRFGNWRGATASNIVPTNLSESSGRKRTIGPCFNCRRMGHFARECCQLKQTQINKGDLLGPLRQMEDQDIEMKEEPPNDPLEAFKSNYSQLENQGRAQDAIKYLGELANQGDFLPA